MKQHQRVSRTVYYAAMSLDGFVAAADGGLAWLDPYNTPPLGDPKFLSKVGALVLGRTTYDQSLGFGPWPHRGKRGLMVTSRPITGLPEGLRAVSLSELSSAVRQLAGEVVGDVWIMGGGRTAGACMSAGLIDELELYVVPHILGHGIPLLGGETSPALTLLEARSLRNGAVMVRYAVKWT